MGAFDSDGFGEAELCAELARAGRVREARGAILHQLVASDDRRMFSDAVVARVRGMIADLARQFAARLHSEGGEAASESEVAEALFGALSGEMRLVEHCHALALEWQLGNAIQRRFAIDPAMPPLVHELIAGDDPAVKALAIELLAAQAAFSRQQERMAVPLHELPAEELHAVLSMIGEAVSGDSRDEKRAAEAEQAIRAGYDEGRTRIALAERLVAMLGDRAARGLHVTHAGAVIFLSALARLSDQPRSAIALATGESQAAWLILALRGAGLDEAALRRAFLAIHPDSAAPPALASISQPAARAMLAGERTGGGA